MSFDLFPDEQQATRLQAARHPSTAAEADTFTNFLPGAASYGMRSLAEVGRAVDLAGSVFPIAVDAVTGGTARQDQYFKEHDEVFNRAVDYWTPRPGEVGAAGQIVGQLAGGLLQAIISPAVLVGTAQLSTSEDLVRQGVDAGAANVVGDIAGISSAIGLKLPALGQALTSRVATGAAGNVVMGAATAGGSRAVLNVAGNPSEAAQFDPWDVRARTLDALMGAAFGGLAHLEAGKSSRIAAKLTATDEAALLVTNQVRHIEDTTAPGRPATDADLTKHVQAMREAVDQVLRGEPVAVDRTTLDMVMTPDAQAADLRSEVQAEMTRLAAQEIPQGAPIEATTVEPGYLSDKAHEPTVPQDLTTARAHAALLENPDLLVPTGHVDPDGNPVHIRAADALAFAADQVTTAKSTAGDLFRTAAACLLGAL